MTPEFTGGGNFQNPKSQESSPSSSYLGRQWQSCCCCCVSLPQHGPTTTTQQQQRPGWHHHHTAITSLSAVRWHAVLPNLLSFLLHFCHSLTVHIKALESVIRLATICQTCPNWQWWAPIATTSAPLSSTVFRLPAAIPSLERLAPLV